jgi:hypothetical protein
MRPVYAPVLAYHADAEVDRLADSLTIGALVILSVVAVPLIGRAPEQVGRGRLTAQVALMLALLGIAAHVALQFMPDESWDTGRRLQLAWGAFLVRLSSFLLAPPLALTAYLRGQGRLAGVALALSLVLPALLVVWFVACGVTDACFH